MLYCFQAAIELVIDIVFDLGFLTVRIPHMPRAGFDVFVILAFGLFLSAFVIGGVGAVFLGRVIAV